ncbi:MAG: HAMP domain-containing sensor histidine kinase [Limnohabitans sp.]|jgi:signal transduction histidine kinase|nr:HAMP domain-containing sensor histidine kinase [Limnohabitans sp.]
MAQGISLANKCQILFGIAVFALLGGALAVPWIRTGTIVSDSQLEVSRQLADTWFESGFSIGRSEGSSIPMRVISLEEILFESEGPEGEFLKGALASFESDPTASEWFARESAGDAIRYRYARAIRERQSRAIADRRYIDWAPKGASLRADDDLAAILLIDRTSTLAEAQLRQNRVTIILSGLAAGVLAMLVFYVILKRVIFGPVRSLTAVAGRIEQGSTSVRAALRTGDDFERLSRAFDGMLDRLEEGQRQLRAANESLDLKIGELAESNVGLYESNRLKSEFLANVSHELRTPLNSIIGFAELLDEIARSDPNADPKRRRYISNILQSGRNLLEMINELLQMAKIEAGRLEVTIGPTSVKDVVEGLVAIMRPQSLQKRLTLEMELEPDLPQVESDAAKLQQILFNFVSNAVKFSPEETRIVIAARRAQRDDGTPCVLASVTDQGPGIPLDMQDTIFEKFRQVDASHTRAHSGTGLGLAICKELAERLGARVSLASTPGEGATFSVLFPIEFKGQVLEPLMGDAKSGSDAS